MKVKESIRSFVTDNLFSYETPKIVQVESKLIGSLNRVVQLVIVVVIIVWVFILNKGYQHTDTSAIVGTTTKLKGIAYSNSTDPRVGRRVWDSADLHVPPQDNGAFFLTTNVIITKNQTQTTCPGVKGKCTMNEDCLPVGKPYHLGNGITTGECNTTTGTCMIEAWCPIEDDSPPEDGDYARLDHTADFTVLLKNYVYFPFFNVGRSNLIESVDIPYLKSCRYHPDDHPFCPIFRIGDIISLSQSENSDLDNDAYFDLIAIKGAVIVIRISWDCDLDYKESECRPKYIFNRLDNYNHNSAPGYNFRYPLNYMEDGIQKRHLVKAYGILFILESDAKARKFNFQSFILNVGSSLALFGISQVFSDILLLHLHRRRKFFKKHIQNTVAASEESDEEEVKESKSPCERKEPI